MRRFWLGQFAAVALLLAGTGAATAETIFDALASAYENNASLNSARAGVRIANERVPLAKSGYRPRVTGTIGITSTAAIRTPQTTNLSFGVEIQQSIFDGFQTRNNIQSAEASVRAERQNLRNSEQNTLFDAAQAYADVVQFRQITVLRARNIEFLDEQLRAARARFDVGEGTRTDVAQAEASLASARAQLASAQADENTAEASYRQIIGKAPGSLSQPKPLSKLLPRSIDAAYDQAFRAHPAILVRNALVDSQLFSVKAAEGAFLPQVSLSANLNQSSNGRTDSTSATLGAQVRIPIYQGGAQSATVRSEKETLGQNRINVDVARDQVRQAVTSAWTSLDASRALLAASNETVRASRLALSGVVEERDVGQRTTLDVLNAQADVLSGQISAVQAERNVVVSSYALASAVGNLYASRLGLNVRHHDPEEHYEQTKDRWFGLRTPDGR